MKRIDATELVNDDGSKISRKVYTSEAVYQQEKEQIFGKSWLYLAHESQFKKPGDFITTFMGETPIIVAMGDDGELHANVNSCTHRGVAVCRTDMGNAKRFVCPYHNWSYKVDGELAIVPQERACKPIDKQANRLKRVPRLESYRGLFFGSFNEEIESLEDFLGDQRFYLDTYFNRFPGGVEVIGAPHKWMVDCNWKLPVENQLGDIGHAAMLHGTSLAGTPVIPVLENHSFTTVAKAGHGAAVRYLPGAEFSPIDKAWGTDGMAPIVGGQAVIDYVVEAQNGAVDLIGEVGANVKGLTYGVFPHFSFLWGNSTIRVSHPRGPGKTEYWSWWVVPKNAPAEVREALRLNYINNFGPGGTLEQEDADAWNLQFRGVNTDYMDDKPLNYELGIGEEIDHPDLPGMAGNHFNEHYARQFYVRWREEMEKGEQP